MVSLGLAAEILIGRFDVAAEMGGCVPRPTRIVENCSRNRNEVGVTGGDDGLGLLVASNQSNGNRENLGY